jgi:hypothetical protein
VGCHRNGGAGWLAIVDWGTALAPIYRAHSDGVPIHVWVDETHSGRWLSFMAMAHAPFWPLPTRGLERAVTRSQQCHHSVIIIH